jgi:Mn2+/Fe2+ NRAMP family transporter
MTKALRSSALIGAAFLMATSAIGPGFLTATTVFTNTLLASCGFAILISVILDIGAQLNVWTILVVKGKRAQDVANEMLPGLGHFLSVLVVLGGIAFNVGNLGGTALGFNVLFGSELMIGAIISAAIAIVIFLAKEFGKVVDQFARILGLIMIGLTLYVAVVARPPMDEVMLKTLVPEKIDWGIIITLVGGTVGGYITFAGGHRLLDSGFKGVHQLPEVRRSAVSGIVLASSMRFLLFLAVLGVVSTGFVPSADNPAASVFRQAAGEAGYKIFGMVMWAAAITSVVGSAYTSVSFIKTFHPTFQRNEKWIIIGFILVSLTIFLFIGNPVKLLVAVGALNGFILPIALSIMIFAAYRSRQTYKHPLILTIFGLLVCIATAAMSIFTIIKDWDKFLDIVK